MIDVDLLSVIRRWHSRDKLSIREIARRTGLSLNTIRKYLSSGEVSPKYPARKSVSKLDNFISDLTDFTRNARMDTKWVEIDFREMVYEVSENLRFMENAEDVKMDLEINQTEPFYSDPLRIGIILNNLISNGVKYFDPAKANSWVKISVQIDSKLAEIEISDNGIGIGEEHMPRIFELFYRATAESFGSGLGLYIVKNAVEKLEGRIEAESKQGTGTHFRIQLPNTHKPE